jgi:hypothetical protein
MAEWESDSVWDGKAFESERGELSSDMFIAPGSRLIARSESRTSSGNCNHGP